MTNKEIQNAYVGSDQAVKLYLGDEVVWPSTPPGPVYSAMPLTFEIISGGTIMWYTRSNPKEIEYSKDNGVTWTSITSSTATSISVQTGDKVQFRGSNYIVHGIGGNSDAMCSSFIGSGANESTAVFEVYGNIMSLLVPNDYEGLQFTDETNCFRCLFNHFGRTTSQSLISAKHLILPNNVVGSCYRGMFIRCAGLVEAPELPATTLADNCYASMFQGCTSLTSAPVLPATTLADNCYNYMFQGCTSLTTAPELPATTLANYCYTSMFNRCTSLTSAPELPATTLTRNCYDNMFNGCTSLTSAPELPATELAQSCYYRMFYSCSILNYIKSLATDISTAYCTYEWVKGVASFGTFVKHTEMTGWTIGNDGIPTNWTVIDA